MFDIARVGDMLNKDASTLLNDTVSVLPNVEGKQTGSNKNDCVLNWSKREKSRDSR